MSDYKDLEEKAKSLRKQVLELALEEHGEGHVGGSYSEMEIMVALFKKILKDEDNFILSKGHACYPLYLLLREKGCNPAISGHPDIDPCNGVCASSGSLGHGLPIGVGMAYARKFQKRGGKIYVLISDGECQEGTTWESLLVASHNKLDNLVVIIDRNGLQALDKTESILRLGNLAEKFNVFGVHTKEINGHSFEEIIEALSEKTPPGKPYFLIAHTVKGKGVSFMENDPAWHGKRVTQEFADKAFLELN